MTTYVLIHGAGGSAWDWHLLSAELRTRGHDVVAVDLPCEDDSAGLSEYADAVVDATGVRSNLVVVAHSFGGFTAPLVCERMPVDLVVLVAGMIPLPGEPPGDWWANTGYEQAKRDEVGRDGPSGEDDDVIGTFLHDVAPELAREAIKRSRDQSATPMEPSWPLEAWPNVPTRFLLGRDDRLFPPTFMRRVVRDRLAITPDEMDGGHMVALSRPRELADRLEAFTAGSRGRA